MKKLILFITILIFSSCKISYEKPFTVVYKSIHNYKYSIYYYEIIDKNGKLIPLYDRENTYLLGDTIK